MKFKINWNYLDVLVTKASTVGGEVTSPVLDSFCFEIQGNLLKVIRTNKELSVVAVTNQFEVLDPSEPHKFVIESAKFSELVKSLKEYKTVTFETLKGDFVGIQAGKYKGSWQGHNPAEFPEIPTLSKNPVLITIDGKEFSKSLERIEYAVMQDGMRSEFRQAYFEGDICWASDSTRYQKVEVAMDVKGKKKFTLVLPVEGFGVAEFLKLSNADKVDIGESGDFYFFIIKDDMFLCKKSNVEAVIPKILLEKLDKSKQGFFVFDVSKLRAVVARIGLTAPLGSRLIQFEFQKGKLVIKSKNRSDSTSEEYFSVTLQGNQNIPQKFGIDWEFLSEALKVITKESATLWVDKQHIILNDGQGGVGIVPMKKGKYGS